MNKRNPKKRKLEKSPPSSSEKRIKKTEKNEDPRIEDSIPLIEDSISLIENLTIESSGNPPPSSQDKPQSEIKIPTITNLETGEPIQILPNFDDKMNKNFIIKPKDQEPYQYLFQMSAKPYEFSFDCSQWISTRLVRYDELDEERYCLIDDQIYLQKSEKMEKLLEPYFNEISYDDITQIYHFKGLSGIGKSHGIIQSVLKYRKKQNYRILHIILDSSYMEVPKSHFTHDFFYCFHKDLEDPDFPKPPKIDNFHYNKKMNKGENWFEFLSQNNIKDDSFLKEISKYLKSKQIAFILIWDQDNIFQNYKKENSYPFLTSVRNSEVFNFVLISASNNNEGFKYAKKIKLILDVIFGFSLEETKEYIQNFIEKLIGYSVEINNDFLEDLYKLTNGNGYLLSKFIRSKGQTLEAKFDNFVKQIRVLFRGTLDKFFEKGATNWETWKGKFPIIITYLDTDIEMPMNPDAIIDKNFSYIENLKLKSVNPFAGVCYLEFYKEQLRVHHLTNNYLSSLEKQISEAKSNPVLKGILYERYVILKFQEYINKNDLNKNNNISYKYKLNNGKIENFDCEINKLLLSFSDDEIKNVLQNYNDGCIIQPAKYNNPVFDMIVWDGKQKFLYVVQITINSSHSAVDCTFFTIKKWQFLLKHANVKQIRFIWVTNKSDFKPKYTEDRIGCLTIQASLNEDE